MTGRGRPAVYGPPSQLARLLESVDGFVHREPAESFAVPELRKVALQLTERLTAKLTSANGEPEALSEDTRS